MLHGLQEEEQAVLVPEAGIDFRSAVFRPVGDRMDCAGERVVHGGAEHAFHTDAHVLPNGHIAVVGGFGLGNEQP